MRIVSVEAFIEFAATVVTWRIERGGLCRGLQMGVLRDNISTTGEGTATIRWSAGNFAIGFGLMEPVLAWMFFIIGNVGNNWFLPMNLVIPDRSTLYLSNHFKTGTVAGSWMIVTLWLDDLPAGLEELPEEELPQPRPRTRGRGRSINLEAVRAILGDDPGVSRPHRRKKPAH